MKRIARRSHEKEIAHELSKESYPDKTGKGGYFSLPPVQIELTETSISYRKQLVRNGKHNVSKFKKQPNLNIKRGETFLIAVLIFAGHSLTL